MDNSLLVIFVGVTFLILVTGLGGIYGTNATPVHKVASVTTTTTHVTTTTILIPLSDVKVAVVYERLYDQRPNRTIEEHIQIFNDTKTDLIFRAWWRWNAIPKNCEDWIGILSNQAVAGCYSLRYSYDHLKNATIGIKREIPGIIIVGAIPAQRILKTDYNPITKQVINYPETWDMSTDPARWGIPYSKIDFQCDFAKSQFWYSGGCNKYDPTNTEAYFPDITNPDFQELFLTSAKMQIDSGADAIWIDMLWTQAFKLYSATMNLSHQGVNESVEGAKNLITEIHNYGLSKGKQIYVGSWIPPDAYTADLDFVTFYITPREVFYMEMNETLWDTRINMTKERVGNVPKFAFLDWGWGDTGPLALFSQNLTREQQSQFLKIADEFLNRKNITFVYPVHGGDLGENPTKCSYNGSYCWYDALAPEFQTYDAIKQLALNKSITTTTTTTTTTSSTTTIPLICTVKGDQPPCDGKVSDFELLDYINKWAKGLVPDFDLLEAINIWVKG